MQKLRTLSQLVILVLLARLIFGFGNSDFEKWCPFGGIETLYLFFGYDTFSCSLGSSNLYMAAAVILLALLAKRSFCGWVCPIGALSEWAGYLRRAIKPGPGLAPPEGVDRWLRLLKYPILAVILFFTFAEKELIFRAFDPCYALCSRHGEDITYWAYVVLGAVLLGGAFMLLPFCRWLCPLAAVLNPFSRFGLLRVVRDPHVCIDCGKCDKECDHGIPVSQVEVVDHARCTACMKCLSGCPKPGSLYIGLPGSGKKEAE